MTTISQKLTEYPENECSCSDCVSMCEYRPCWGTPEDIEKIIDAGLADKLMEDYWVGDGKNGQDISIPAPAIRGREGKRASFVPVGTCTFLKDGLCQLHNGLKPLEGRVASCKSSPEMTRIYDQIRKDIVQSWNTPEGERVYQKWRKALGMPEDKEFEFSGLEMLFKLFEFEKKLHKNKDSDT